MPNDIRTQAIILRRTNYGESDRILNLLTPEGKLSVLARGVRKEKSRLAGGIELFSVSDVVVHQGRSNLGILTSAKMLRFYGNILADLPRLELASECLRKAEKAAAQMDNPEYFTIIEQVLLALNQATDSTLVKTWFTLNLAQAMGETVNVLSDTTGAELSPLQKYFWDSTENALRADPRGFIGAREIKLARLLLAKDLQFISKIQNLTDALPPLTAVARAFEIP